MIRLPIKALARHVAVALVIVAGAGAAATPAHATVGADPDDVSATRSCGRSNLYPSPYDSGGNDAESFIGDSNCYGYSARAHFDAYGEVMRITALTPSSTVRRAKVILHVYNAAGTDIADVDRLTFRESGSIVDKHNLGTPDGSGDIPEGRKVRFYISMEVKRSGEWVRLRGAWVTGRS